MACIVAITAEVARSVSGDAIAFIGRELRTGLGQETDAAFLAILTAGITPIPSSGGTALGVRSDLRALLAAVTTGSNSKLFLITTPTIAGELSVVSDASGAAAFPGLSPTGGSISGMQVLVSSAAAAGTITLIDASQIAALADVITMDSAGETTLQMDDAPDSPPASSSNNLSLWQQNLTALRAERSFVAVRLRTTAVAQLSGASYSGNSPS